MSTTTNGTHEYTITVDQHGVDVHWQGQTLTVEATELRDGGWEHAPTCDRNHCDEGDCPGCIYCDGEGNLPGSAEALKRWHDESSGHAGPFRFCYAEPCKPVADALGAWG